MNTVRWNKWFKVAVLATAVSFAGAALAADGADTTMTDGADTPSNMPQEMMHRNGEMPMSHPMGKQWGHWQGHRMHGHHGWMNMLGLTTEQRNKIKELKEENRAAHSKLHDDMRANRMALMTTAPTDPSYAALVAKAKELNSEKIQVNQDLKAKVYREVLTEEQRNFAQALMKHMKVVMANRPTDHKWSNMPHPRPMPGPQGE